MSGNRRTPVPPLPATELPVVELFSSMQGEGPWVGCRQVFLRLADCNLDCRYCDTPHTAGETCRIEDDPGSGRFLEQPSPMALAEICHILQHWQQIAPGLHHSLSLTGGEPLVHGEALRLWLPELREYLPIYLETNGTLAHALEPLLPHIDIISVDLKMPSVAGGSPLWAEHRRFLQLAWNLPGYVKAVVSEETPLSEVEEAARLMAEEAEHRDLILQPVTIHGRPAVSGKRLMQLQRFATSIHPHVRVIPQTHPSLNVL